MNGAAESRSLPVGDSDSPAVSNLTQVQQRRSLVRLL